MLPNFLIIGAPKAGTTAVSGSLAVHPQVFVAPEKEVHYFDKHFGRGVDWYRARFAGARNERAVGEASPTYMYIDQSMERIAALLPEAKLVVVLRNPIDRAYSHYWWMHALFEKKTFEDSVRRELAGATDVRPYARAGVYVDRLKRVREICPDAPLHVMILEDFRARPDAEFGALCRFLGVDDTHAPSELGEVRNAAYRLRWPWLRKLQFRFSLARRVPAGLVDAVDRWNRVPFRYPPMDQSLRRELERYYAGPNAALAAWLGRDLSAWEPSESREPTERP